MNQSQLLLDCSLNPIFVFDIDKKSNALSLRELNQAALDLLGCTRDDMLLLEENPEDWFPFLKSFQINKTKTHKVTQGELYTQQDLSILVDIKPTVYRNENENFLVLSVSKSKTEPEKNPELQFGKLSLVSESTELSKLLRALNAAAEKMDKEITPEGIFEAVKTELRKLGYSCSIYLTTPDLKYIYPKFLSYSPLIVKIASKFFGNPYEFMIPVDSTFFSKNLVKYKKTVFASDAGEHLKELLVHYPSLKPLNARIIEWMSRFLKKTISSPLIAQNKVIGALTVHAGDLSEKDTAAIKVFAHQVAVAMHKASLLENLQKNLDEKDKIEKALRVSEARLKLAFEAADDAIWDYSLQTRKLYLGPRFYSILGFGQGELKPDMKTVFELIHPDDQERVRSIYNKCMNEPNRRFMAEYRVKNKAGNWLHIRTKAKFVNHGENDAPTRFVGISSDISEQKEAEENLIHLAFHDALTGLLNRKAFSERSDEYLTALKRKEKPALAAYLYIDFDHFKDINDTFGHNVGDECLKQATQRLIDHIRESDLLFRLGGDEFFLILRDIKRPTDASLVAQKLIKSFMKPFFWNDQPLYLHLSIGIALYPKDGKESWELLSNADTALYKAKVERNTYRFYDEEMQIEAIKKITIVNDIRRALANDEFQMYYQPIFTCDKKLVSAEALIRWFGDDGNMISPTSFIPWAEESGLIIPVGMNVFNMVTEDLAEWQSQGQQKIPVSINISAKQLKQHELISNMEKLLQSKSLDPAFLHLEITESSLIDNLEEILEKLDDLKKSGLKFSIDDFGTGYSSLHHLKKLPIDILKIDKSFIEGLPEGQDSVIVKAIITLAQQLDLKVVAEGVENKEQLNFLKENGSPYIQGYYFSKPLSKSDFSELVRQTHKP